MTEHSPASVIAHIAKASEIFASQAGVGGMETAGSIISYLAEHPEHIDAFMACPSLLDWPVGWHEQGRLTWHGMDGKVHSPEQARRQRIIKQMEKTGNAETAHD
jgi:hypothetical protein